jgi:hypothetical protein
MQAVRPLFAQPLRKSRISVERPKTKRILIESVIAVAVFCVIVAVAYISSRRWPLQKQPQPASVSVADAATFAACYDKGDGAGRNTSC